MGYDKDTLPDYLDQKGISSGILIDEQCRSSIEGLFACGTNSDQMNLGCVPRNKRSINAALKKIELLDKYYERVSAANYHELMRSHEVGSLLQTAKIMCCASLERKESRFDAFFWRSDYPDTDNQNFDGQVVVWREADGIKTSFKSQS